MGTAGWAERGAESVHAKMPPRAKRGGRVPSRPPLSCRTSPPRGGRLAGISHCTDLRGATDKSAVGNGQSAIGSRGQAWCPSTTIASLSCVASPAAALAAVELEPVMDDLVGGLVRDLVLQALDGVGR